MKKFKIHGKLGKQVGRHWKLHVPSIAEGLKAIQANKPEFDNILFEQSQKGVAYAIRDHSTNEYLDKNSFKLKL